MASTVEPHEAETSVQEAQTADSSAQSLERMQERAAPIEPELQASDLTPPENTTSQYLEPNSVHKTDNASNETRGPSALSDTMAELSLQNHTPDIETGRRVPSGTHAADSVPSDSASLDADTSEHWPIKWIQWPPECVQGEFPEVRPIIMQRHNGPCSFIALCNILLLKSDITLPPHFETTVPFDILAGLVVDHILANSQDPQTKVENLFQTIPKTRVGLDVDPHFGSIHDFEVPPDREAEIHLFAQAKVPLIHGWLAESQDPLSHDALVERSGSYEQATVRLAQADALVNGLLLSTEASAQDLLSMAKPRSQDFSPEEKQLVQDGCLIRDFLSTTQSQLSHEGLFAFISSLQPGSLSALFRANHLSVLYRAKRAQAPLLFTLVTDSAFLHEPNKSTVWESLETVEGNNTFVNANLTPVRSSPANDPIVQTDRQLAQQLQAEQDAAMSPPVQASQSGPARPVTAAEQPPIQPRMHHSKQPAPPKKRRSCVVS